MKIIRQEGTLLPGATARPWESIYPELISPQKLLYRDDFAVVSGTGLSGRTQATLPSAWGSASGDMLIHADDYVYFNSSASSGGGGLVTDSDFAESGEVMVRGYYDGLADSARIGVAFRGDGFTAGGTGSWLAYLGSTGLVIARIAAGTVTVVSTTPVTVADGVEYSVCARWEGDEIQAFGAGVVSPVVTDSTWDSKTGIGLYLRRAAPRILNWRAGRLEAA